MIKLNKIWLDFLDGISKYYIYCIRDIGYKVRPVALFNGNVTRGDRNLKWEIKHRFTVYAIFYIVWRIKAINPALRQALDIEKGMLTTSPFRRTHRSECLTNLLWFNYKAFRQRWQVCETVFFTLRKVLQTVRLPSQVYRRKFVTPPAGPLSSLGKNLIGGSSWNWEDACNQHYPP